MVQRCLHCRRHLSKRCDAGPETGDLERPCLVAQRCLHCRRHLSKRRDTGPETGDLERLGGVPLQGLAARSGPEEVALHSGQDNPAELALCRVHPLRTAGRFQLPQDPERQQVEVLLGRLPG